MLYLLLLSLLFVGESSAQLVNETEETPVPDGADGDLSSLKAENRKLEREKIRLTEECQKDIDYWSKLYNDTYNSLSHDMPEVAELEKKLSEAVAKEDRLDKAVEELGTHTKLFYLKKISLRGTIDFLVKYEDDAQTCINHGDYIGFQRNFEKKALRPALRSRALSTRKRSLLLSRQAVDNTEVEKERQNILMDIMVQQEKYKNEELKAYIEYYSLYCQRNVQHYQDLLESLKRWPEAKVLVQQIEEEIQRENERITNKTQNLLDERNKLQSIISELMKLQEEYDRLRDAADCFDRLNKWPIADALASLQGNLQGVLNFRPNQIEDRSHFALTKVIDKYNKNDYTSIKIGSRSLL